MRQHLAGDRRCRADHLDRRAEARQEGFAEALEEMDVLCLLGRELQQGAVAPVVGAEFGPGMIHHEGQDEFLDQAEDVEIFVAADLVEGQALGRREAGNVRRARQRLGHEGAGEVEHAARTDQVLDAPVDAFGSGQGIAEGRIVEGSVHRNGPFRGRER